MPSILVTSIQRNVGVFKINQSMVLHIPISWPYYLTQLFKYAGVDEFSTLTCGTISNLLSSLRDITKEGCHIFIGACILVSFH